MRWEKQTHNARSARADVINIWNSIGTGTLMTVINKWCCFHYCCAPANEIRIFVVPIIPGGISKIQWSTRRYLRFGRLQASCHHEYLISMQISFGKFVNWFREIRLRTAITFISFLPNDFFAISHRIFSNLLTIYRLRTKHTTVADDKVWKNTRACDEERETEEEMLVEK